MGASIISLTGLGLVAVAIQQLVLGVTGLAGLVVTGATLLLGVAFALTGPVSYRTTISSRHLLRIAGWNTLGVIATSAVLGLVYLFQRASGGSMTAPLLSGAVVVGVSAFAHVLIGFNDVRRIRARTVAQQRRKATVIDRFVRHDLKHAAQILIGYGEHLTENSAERESSREIGEKIVDVGTDLSETQAQIQVFDEVFETDGDREVVDLTELLTEQQSRLQEQYPEATVETALPDTLRVVTGSRIDAAFEELLDNAFAHGGDPPTVHINAERTDNSVKVEILDTGDGFPSNELTLINEDQTETQLQHSSGLGLWLAKWVIETYDGMLRLGHRDDGEGGKVSVRLPGGPQKATMGVRRSWS
jgi:signal transduction histidine kinase